MSSQPALRRPETLAYLTDGRREIFLERPVSWVTGGRLVTRVGDPDAQKQTERLLRLVADAKALDSA